MVCFVVLATGFGLRPRSAVVCCGTFFIMRDVRLALKLDYPVDPYDINEQSMTNIIREQKQRKD